MHITMRCTACTQLSTIKLNNFTEGGARQYAHILKLNACNLCGGELEGTVGSDTPPCAPVVEVTQGEHGATVRQLIASPVSE